VQSSARHLLALINDVLDLTKIEAGKRDLHLEPVACREVIAEVIASQLPLALAKGIGLEIDERAQDIVVLTNLRALSQILLNLVNNAIKFTERGGVVVSVRREAGDWRLEPDATTGLQPPASRLIFAVSDTGSGIRHEDQDKLFQVFTQIDASSTRQYEGAGLGLYLSQKLAGLLDGRIDFQSEYGQGSTFTLVLADRRQMQTGPDPEHKLAAPMERNGTWPRS